MTTSKPIAERFWENREFKLMQGGHHLDVYNWLHQQPENKQPDNYLICEEFTPPVTEKLYNLAEVEQIARDMVNAAEYSSIDGQAYIGWDERLWQSKLKEWGKV